tara:strand:+ start:84 stop:779 length:696 start_codon:yes stop_codon:yes gene_type:complete
MHNYLIIGGSSGIGQSLVNLLKDTDDQVFATYNSTKRENLNSVQYFHLDVLDDQYDLDLLPDTLHGLVYCPGSIQLKPFQRFSEEDFINDYRLQVTSAVRIIQELLPRLKKAEQSSIVLFSTVAVQNGFNFHSLVSSSKGAVEGLTRALAAELAPNIRVNAIAPSLTDTPLAGKLLSNDQRRKALSEQNPFKRVAEATDIAQAACYLLKSDSSYVTGQILHVDGGMSVIKN